MSFFYNNEQDQILPFPNGYQQNQNYEIQQPKSSKENDLKNKIIPNNNNNDHLKNQRNRIFEYTPEIKVRQELYQTRYQSTTDKRHRIFDQEKTIDLTHKKVQQNQNSKVSNNNNIKSLILNEMETIKQKSQLYSGIYSQLLQKLIQIVESNKEDYNLQLDPDFNNIIFKIRTLQGLDINRKIQIEKIINVIVNQEEKLLFQGLVKELIQNEWMYWIEPLYFDIQKQQIPKEQWKQFIEKQKQIYKI